MVFNEHSQTHDPPREMQDLPAGQGYHFRESDENGGGFRTSGSHSYQSNFEELPLSRPPGGQHPILDQNKSSRNLLHNANNESIRRSSYGGRGSLGHGSYGSGCFGHGAFGHYPSEHQSLPPVSPGSEYPEPEYDFEALRMAASRLLVLPSAPALQNFDRHNEILSIPDFAHGRPDSTFNKFDVNESWIIRQWQQILATGSGGLGHSKTRKMKLVQGSVLTINYPVPSDIKNAIKPRCYITPSSIEEEFIKMRYKRNDFTLYNRLNLC
ncbi:hypothetical protein HZS61_006187 [Fusarium oxysporum f. sp. conglutinans]|nr:hypothetical protein HZS61_006187 [Fusarium oxysporum f. sp. conglutinans]KAG6988640.1 Chitin synthase 1 [Fusarium oxysporum f. sp. conglutinans]